MSDLHTKAGFSGVEQVQFPDNPAATRAIQQINQFLLGTFGARGVQSRRVLTHGDAVALGLATYSAGGATPDIPPGLNPGVSSTDPSIPPAPTGFAAFSGVASSILSWDDPTFSYFGHTEVWRSIADDLVTAIYVGETQASLYADYPGATGITYFYWVRHVSQAGNPGPYNAVSGVSTTTGQVQNGDISNGAIDSLKIANLAVVAAKIADLAVTTAKIANLAVTNAKINDLAVGKLTAGNIATGQYIASTNYSAGVSGYLIDYTGYAEFQNIKARGDIQATSVTASMSISSPTITSGSISAASITGGTIYGTTIDTATMIAGVVRSSGTMGMYYTPSGSRIPSVGSFFGGYAQWWDLTATGTALALQVNGKFRVYADGLVEIDEPIIVKSNVLASGTKSGAPLARWTPAAVYDPGGGLGA